MKRKNEHGMISVFLAIILVPCIVITSIFVDLGRSHMSRAMAEASADLALNTLMTNYDADLDEWYGLIASCQDIDKYYDTASMYFLRTMMSQKMEKDEAYLVSDYIQQAFEDKTITDLLACDVLTEPTEIVRPVSGANLSSSGLMKVQIVEFMKYRAPIEIARGLIGRLNGDEESFDNGGEEKDEPSDPCDDAQATRNEDHVNKKQEFYKAEGEFESAAFKAYVEIRKYFRDVCKPFQFNWPAQYNHPDEMTSRSPDHIDNERLQYYIRELDVYREAYSKIHKLYVERFANTDTLHLHYKHFTLKKDGFQPHDYEDAVKKEKTVIKDLKISSYIDKYFDEEEKDGQKIHTITYKNYHYLLDELKAAIKEFRDSSGSMGKNGTEELQQLLADYDKVGDGDSDVNKIQWWVKLDKAVTGGSGDAKTMENSAKKMMLLWMLVGMMGGAENVSGMVLVVKEDDKFPKPDKPKEQWSEEEQDHQTSPGARASDLLKQANDQWKQFLDPNSTGGANMSQSGANLYWDAVKKLETISNDQKMLDMLDPGKVEVDVNGTPVFLKDALQMIGGNVDGLREQLDRMINQLESALKQMEGLDELADNYHKGYDNWHESAFNSSDPTDLMKEDQVAFEGGYTDEKAVMNVPEDAKQVDSGAVRALRRRLNSIKGQLETMLKGVDGFTYGGTPVSQLKSVDDMRKMVDNTEIKKLLDEDWTNAGVKKTAEKTDLAKPAAGTPVVSLQHLDEDNYDPDIDPTKPRCDDKLTPPLYVYFEDRWWDKPDDAVNESDKVKDELDQMQQDLKEQTVGKVVKEDNDRVDIVREYSGNSEFSAVTGVFTSLIGVVEMLISGDFKSIRDNAYAITYIMGMFSYDTFTNEGLWKLQSLDNRKKNIGLLNYKVYYDDDDIKEQWASEDLDFRMNKSLTNKMICRENNAAWEAEVEYILYGKSKCSDNVRAAYTSILFLRMVVNTISAFVLFFPTNPEDPTSALLDSIASLISTACLGIIPPPVWKALLVVILALAESGIDLARLAAGFPLPIYKKSRENWYLHIPSEKELAEKAKAAGEAAGEQALSMIKGLVSSDNGQKEQESKGMDPWFVNGNDGYYYSDYMLLFLIMNTMQNKADKENDMYLRIAEIIQTNMRQHEGIDESYSLRKAQVYFRLRATIRVRPLMIALPIVKSYEGADVGSLEQYSDWCTYTINTVRGYS